MFVPVKRKARGCRLAVEVTVLKSLPGILAKVFLDCWTLYLKDCKKKHHTVGQADTIINETWFRVGLPLAGMPPRAIMFVARGFHLRQAFGGQVGGEPALQRFHGALAPDFEFWELSSTSGLPAAAGFSGQVSAKKRGQQRQHPGHQNHRRELAIAGA